VLENTFMKSLFKKNFFAIFLFASLTSQAGKYIWPMLLFNWMGSRSVYHKNLETSEEVELLEVDCI